VETVTVPHAIRSKIGEGSSGLVIGGVAKRAAPHHWDGRIEGVRLLHGDFGDVEWKQPLREWGSDLVHWSPATKDPRFVWDGANIETVEAGDSFRKAMNDLCQVLLNTNEFFYLH
jgi:hypothetical protein